MQINAPPHRVPSRPPLAAIDRFLCGHNSHNCGNYYENGLIGGFSPESCGGERQWFEIEGRRRVEEELELELELEEEMYCEVGLNNEVKICSKVKKLKKGSSANLIKGQWTEDEDR